MIDGFPTVENKIIIYNVTIVSGSLLVAMVTTAAAFNTKYPRVFPWVGETDNSYSTNDFFGK